MLSILRLLRYSFTMSGSVSSYSGMSRSSMSFNMSSISFKYSVMACVPALVVALAVPGVESSSLAALMAAKRSDMLSTVMLKSANGVALALRAVWISVILAIDSVSTSLESVVLVMSKSVARVSLETDLAQTRALRASLTVSFSAFLSSALLSCVMPVVVSCCWMMYLSRLSFLVPNSVILSSNLANEDQMGEKSGFTKNTFILSYMLFFEI